MAKSKYRSIKTNGFHSRRESRRFDHLTLLERAGEIRDLKTQVEYVLAPTVVVQGRKRPPLRYFADFTYTDKDGSFIVEDSKGMRTETYRLKRHLMKSVHGIEILET